MDVIITSSKHAFIYWTSTLYKVLTQLAVNRHGLPQRKKAAIVSTLCKLSNIYNVELNAYQKLHGLCLRTSGTSKKAINKLSQLYDSVCYTTLTNIMNDYSKESKALMAEWAAAPVIHCGDNLDIRSHARYEGRGVSSHDIHLYNNIIFKCRVPVDHLSDVTPSVDLSNIDYGQFILNGEEEQSLAELVKSVVKESWQSHLSNTVKVAYPPNKYATEMKCKTEKVKLFNSIFLQTTLDTWCSSG